MSDGDWRFDKSDDMLGWRGCGTSPFRAGVKANEKGPVVCSGDHEKKGPRSSHFSAGTLVSNLIQLNNHHISN